MNTHHIRPIELTHEDEVYEPDIPGASIELKHHQRVALARCVQMENVGLYIPYGTRYALSKSKIGIMGDKVGSGKSYVMLALMAVNPVPEVAFNRVNVYGDDKLYVEYRRPEVNLVEMNVIVCSFGLVDQWKTYVRTFFSKGTSMRLCVISRKSHVDEFKKLRWGMTRSDETFVDTNTELGIPNIVIVASSMYHLLAQILEERNACVTRVVFDEADSAVTPKAHPIVANYYWLMTASWKNIINPIYAYNVNSIHTGIVKNTFLRNIFMNFLRVLPFVDKVNLLGGMVVKNNDEFVKHSFMLPAYRENYIQCKDTIADMLNGVTKNALVLRAINAGDMETAVGLLNKSNKGDENHITDLVMADLKKDLHNIVQTIQYVEQLIVVNAESRRERLEQLRRDKERMQTRIQLLTDRIHANSDCMVCFSSPGNRTITKCCHNTFCFECICKWLNVRSSCPLCREKITITDHIMMITDDDNGTEVSGGGDGGLHCVMSKFDTLVKLLGHIREGNAHAKILIFSEFDRTFEKIAHVIRTMGMRYGMLKGPGLMKNMERFKADTQGANSLDILMINSTAYGSGMNLENSTDVILFHHSNKQTEAQVIGRAQRPGRTSYLNVWHLVNETERSSLESDLNTRIEMFSFHNVYNKSIDNE